MGVKENVSSALRRRGAPPSADGAGHSPSTIEYQAVSRFRPFMPPQEAPFAETTCVGLEFGSHPLEEVLHALRQDNWLHFHGDPGAPAGREAKAHLRERFYPADDRWKEMIWQRADDAISRALGALGRG